MNFKNKSLLQTLLLFVFVACLASIKAGAQGFACEKLNVANCPTMFVEKCLSSSGTFFRANRRDCLRATEGLAQDKSFCTADKLASCQPAQGCDDTEDDVVQQFFCKKGQSHCERNTTKLVGKYNKVLQGLTESLSKYKTLTDLDLSVATNVKILCEYPIAQLGELRAQAENDVQKFKKSEKDIQVLDACSNTLEEFFDAGAPEGLTAELWDSLKSQLSGGMKQILQTRGQVQSNIEALEQAPKKLKSLGIAYQIGCPVSS